MAVAKTYGRGGLPEARAEGTEIRARSQAIWPEQIQRLRFLCERAGLSRRDWRFAPNPNLKLFFSAKSPRLRVSAVNTSAVNPQ